jgi:1-deoxyxylulose-5-phosphate synthase
MYRRRLIRQPSAEMEYVRLGTSELKVSRVCLGMMSYGNPSPDHPSWRAWHLDEDAAAPIVRRAVEGGVTFFDTADSYAAGASERVTGGLLRRFFTRREDYVVATKVFYPTGPGPNERGLSRQRILAAIDDSLVRLGVDYVDLYQIHRWDDEAPIEETMEALADVVRAGKARYLGASSMFAWQLSKAQYCATAGGWSKFVSLQNHYNLVYREEEREMIPLCLDQGVGLMPYSPLARGLLAGTRQRGERGGTVRAANDPLAASRYDESDFDIVDAVRQVAAEKSAAPAQISLAWLFGRPAVNAVVVGATRPGHIDDAIAALDIALDEDAVSRLEARYVPHAIQGHE